jgi:HSP20 family protein
VREFASLRDSLSRALGQSVQAVTGSIYPLVDIYQTEDSIIIRTASLDGNLENVDVTMEEDLLVIRGETKSEDNLPAETYLQRERRFGKFSRALRIPYPVHADKAKARFKNGVLTITLPKAEDTRPEITDVEATE